MYIVTGGGSGIGKSLAISLAARLEDVLIVGRDVEKLSLTASYSSHINYVQADLGMSAEREKVQNYLKDIKNIKGLINNAGTVLPIVSIADISEEDWHATMRVNLDAPLFLIKLLRNKLVNGRVLNISTKAAHFPIAAWSAYCSSKAALDMLTRCCQLEMTDIAFGTVMPGIIDTDMQQQIRNSRGMQKEKFAFFHELKNEKKLLSSDTVAQFLCWLLLDIDSKRFSSQEWDIYDKNYQHEWLVSPYTVPDID
ncbi:MAG: sepiapterin reductase [Legionellales bacterium RIFCSPHIGHO2_12_FULL_35_11]|nr:MAG: sepiapterin reductase [Legionellales bacterium RIFCSPHIGHO2_12_FULL_35_11]